MENKIRLYPPVKVTGQSFKNVKKCVVPNQSMSLREILTRFVRREPLPVLNDGLYEDRFGDIEKMKNEDIVDINARKEKMESEIKDYEKRDKKRKAEIEAAKKKAEENPPTPPIPPKP